MNPHKLIFDYLDGEITREDDKMLRDLLKEDTTLSRDFQSFLDLSFEYNKSNEDFIYPELFLDNVEENIIARIESDNAARKEKERRRRVFFGYSIAAVPAFILLLVLTTFNFGNIELNLNKLLTDEKAVISTEESIAKAPELEANQVTISRDREVTLKSKVKPDTKNSLPVATEISKNSALAVESTLNNSNEQITISENNSTTLDNTNNRVVENEKSNDSNVQTNDRNISEAPNTLDDKFDIFENKSRNEQYSIGGNISSSTSKISNADQMNPLNPFTTNFNSFASINGTGVEMNSFFGKEFATFGVMGVKNTVSSFTQSIAAKIDDYTKIGLETGYMDFSGEESKYTIIQKGKTNLTGNPKNTDKNKILNNDDNDNTELIRISGTEVSSRRLYWAGIFYERNLLEMNRFALSSRLGFGASDIGFVSSLKVIGKYELFRRVDLTIGADAKIFNGTQEFFVNKNSISSTVSFIYGVRFAF